MRIRMHLGGVSGLCVWSEDGLGGAVVGSAGVDGKSFPFFSRRRASVSSVPFGRSFTYPTLFRLP